MALRICLSAARRSVCVVLDEQPGRGCIVAWGTDCLALCHSRAGRKGTYTRIPFPGHGNRALGIRAQKRPALALVFATGLRGVGQLSWIVYLWPRGSRDLLAVLLAKLEVGPGCPG